jgi:hypothetical protein
MVDLSVDKKYKVSINGKAWYYTLDRMTFINKEDEAGILCLFFSNESEKMVLHSFDLVDAWTIELENDA